MSMAAQTISSTDLMYQQYRGEFQLSNLNSLKSRSLRTPSFCPMSNVNIKFCFEVYYTHSNIPCSYKSERSYTHDFMLFKLRLLTLCASGLPPKMRLKLDVGLYFCDGSVLHQYKLFPDLTIFEMKSVTFDDVVTTNQDHLYKLVKHSFNIKCQMEFFNHLQVPLAHNKELNSFNHFKNFSENFKSIQKFGELSDITVNIGEKSLPAHKAILSAHSPVFRNMFTHDFKESLTNTLTITDFTFDVFECFLKYMYSGEIVDKSLPTVKQLYLLADKYDVINLKPLLAEIIIPQITIKTICDILSFAFDYDDDKIKKEGVGFAAVHMRELIPTKEWKELNARHPLAGYEAAINYVL